MLLGRTDVFALHPDPYGKYNHLGHPQGMPLRRKQHVGQAPHRMAHTSDSACVFCELCALCVRQKNALRAK